MERTASTLTVAAVQLVAGEDPAANLRLVEENVARAAAAGAELVVCPEATMARFGTPLRSVAEPLDGPFADGLRRIAERFAVLLVAGMFTPSGERVRNTLVVTGRGVDSSYDKIHLYDAFGSRESDTVEPGLAYVTVEALGTTIGLATCYDVRFADQFSALGRAGAEVVCLPTCWGDGPRKAEQWDTLVRARAMDAQAWLVAADMAWSAPAGSAPRGIGRSAVVDPLGHVENQLGSEPGVLVATVDLDQVRAVRERVPVL